MFLIYSLEISYMCTVFLILFTYNSHLLLPFPSLQHISTQPPRSLHFLWPLNPINTVCMHLGMESSTWAEAIYSGFYLNSGYIPEEKWLLIPNSHQLPTPPYIEESLISPSPSHPGALPHLIFWSSRVHNHNCYRFTSAVGMSCTEDNISRDSSCLLL